MENESLLKPKFDPNRLMIFGEGDLITRLYIHVGLRKAILGSNNKETRRYKHAGPANREKMLYIYLL
jgi:hypothetical protein